MTHCRFFCAVVLWTIGAPFAIIAPSGGFFHVGQRLQDDHFWSAEPPRPL